MRGAQADCWRRQKEPKRPQQLQVFVSQSAGFALRHPPRTTRPPRFPGTSGKESDRHSSIRREMQRGVLRFQADHPRSCDHQRSRAAGRCSFGLSSPQFSSANRMKRRGIGWKPPGPIGFPGKKEGASPSVQLRINGFPSMSCRFAAKQQSALVPVMRPERAGTSFGMPDLPGPQ
jgi:hypothetical protein